jgi:V/A-type H+-transporting ATPase subunit I
VTAGDAFKLEMKQSGWGALLRDPLEGETPPVLVEPPKIFRPVKALFDGLGIAPGYTEADVSVPFMCYFTLFFAMLVGDGAYGLIFLAATLALRKRLARSWFVLMTVFSCATVLWGLLSNTWFGTQIPCCADWPTVVWLADPSYGNMMLLCFTIGASHLMLARIWNGICRLNSLECLVEFGWAGVLLFMYFVVNSIVGIMTGVPTWAFWVFGVSVLMIVSKTRGIELGMLPLNIMGSMGDIISYVRLFAVGYASLQGAQNFNEMALAFDLPLWAKVIPAVLILLFGHLLNLMLAGLAVLVHAVRLNTLEFSTHKGLTWSGRRFNPFKKNR